MHEEQENGETVTHLSTDEARGGTTAHNVRYVLAISLILAVILLAIVVAAGYWQNGRNNEDSLRQDREGKAVPSRP